MKLENRLHLGLAVSLTLLMVLLGWAQYSVIANLTQSMINSRSEHDSQSLLASISFDENGHVSLNENRLATVYQQPFSGHYFQIQIANRQPVRSRSLWDWQLDITAPELGTDSNQTQTGPDGQHLLIYVATYQKQGHELSIIIAEDITPVEQQLQYYSAWFVGIALAALLFLLLVQRWIVHISFRPLTQVQQEILNLSEGKQGRLTEDVPAEIRPLVSAVNHLLFVLTERLQRSRNALGNLAHTLKGPLSLMTQLADDERVKQHPDIHTDMLKYSQRMQQIINHELKRARLAGSGMAGQKFIPSQDIPDLIQVLQQMYRQKDLHFDCRIADGSFGDTDRDDMLELLGNLLENSCKWAKSQIRCTIEIQPRLAIVIEDDGEGCNEQQLDLILQRGSKVDEDMPGHGLGMTIVKEIAQLYQFDLQLGRSVDLGGFRASLHLNPPPGFD